jgi:DNA-binding CsgD family transcriptional regulator
MPTISMERVIDALFSQTPDNSYFVSSNKTMDNADLLKAFCVIYGLKHCSYISIDKQSLIVRKPKFLVTYPNQWQEAYSQILVEQRDSLLQAGLTEVLPFDWGQFRCGVIDVNLEPSITTRRALGSQGLSVPIRNGSGTRALFSVTGDYIDKDWQDIKRKFMRDFVTLAHFFHKRVSGEVLDSDPKLSEREKQILQLCALGMTSGGIADRLEVTVSTVKYFLNHVRQKMDVTNTTHAVAKAIKLGIITAI